MINKSMIFKRAWEIARGASQISGYKASEYFASSLRIAWAEEKAVKTTQLEQIKFVEKEFALPKLKGSEKQIAWANDIMTSAFSVIANYVSKEVDSLNRRIAHSLANPDKVITEDTVVKINAFAETLLRGYAVMFGIRQMWFNAHPKAWTIIRHRDEWCKPSTINITVLQHYASMTVEEAFAEKEARIDKEMSDVYGINWKETENY